MGKLLTVDDLEIIFEKQNDNHDCRWCVYVRARKGQKEKNVLMIKLNNKPYTRFLRNDGTIVKNSKDVLKDIMSNIVQLIWEMPVSKLEKDIMKKSNKKKLKKSGNYRN